MKINNKTTDISNGQGTVGPQGATGPQGAAGPQGPIGPAGVVGADGIDGLPYDIGSGEPTLGYTQTTAIGDRYLDGVSGNVWERIPFGTEFGPDTLVLAGDLTWKVVATLKGPQGPALQTTNQLIIEGGEGEDPFLLIREYDYDQEQIVDVLKVTTETDANSSNIYFKVRKNNVLFNFMQFYGANKFLIFDGLNGIQFPSLTLAEMEIFEPGMNTAFVAFCSDTQKLRITTLAGWVDLH